MLRYECINPDDFLQTPEGRVWTPERNRQAWHQAFEAVRTALTSLQYAGRTSLLYVVCGIQGSGKSTWIRENGERLVPCVFFDAALPGVRHRARLIAIARELGSTVRGVWINTPLALALQRNAMRNPDERVPEDAMVSVNGQLEAPQITEGFEEVTEITASIDTSSR
jgi:AAA domain